MFFCTKIASEPRVKLAGRKSAINTLVVYSTDRSVGGPGVSLTLCCFVIYFTRRFVLSLALFYFVLVFFSPFGIAITLLEKEKANLSAFWYVCSICACLVLSVSSSSPCLGWAAACDCSTPWTFLLPLLLCSYVFLNINKSYNF